jgi:hypothetical protein
MLSVLAINLGRRLVLLTDDRVMPITNLFDLNSEETDDPDQAITFVAGEGNTWFSGRVDGFERVLS